MTEKEKDDFLIYWGESITEGKEGGKYNKKKPQGRKTSRRKI